MPTPARKRIVFLLTTFYGVVGDIVRGMRRQLRVRGDITLSTASLPDLDPALRALRARADAVVGMVSTPRLSQRLQRLGLPVVNLSSNLDDRAAPFPRVCADNLAIGALAALYFWERGFRRFAFLGEPRGGYSLQREGGYAGALRERGADLMRFHFRYPRDTRTPARVRAWLRGLPPRTALFCCDDHAAGYVLALCEDAGVAVPQQVAVLGVNNDSAICDVTPVPLSSIAHRGEAMGMTAAELACRLLDGRPVARRPILTPPGVIVTRASTDVLAVEDALVARALAMVKERATAGIRVPDVVAEAHASRRLVEQRFRASLGCSIYQMIQRIRIQKAEDLLLDSHLSVGAIADACGFSDLHHLVVNFRRLTGLTPTQFRRRGATAAGA